MVLKDKNIDFLKANLFEDEAAGDTADNNSEMIAGPCASTNYAKRKRKEEEALAKKMSLAKQEQVAFLKDFIAPTNTDNDSKNIAVNQSVIDKNLAYAEDKKKSAAHIEALTKTEKINNLIAVITTPLIFDMYDAAEKNALKAELKSLLM
jgi:hypothetical protein